MKTPFRTIIKQIVSPGLNYLMGKELSWPAHMKKLVKRDIIPHFDKAVEEKGSVALFWTPMSAWPHMIIEYCLATALRCRGYNSVFAVCDGGLPHCEMERANFKRPECRDCWGTGKEILSAFDLPHRKLSEFITRNEISDTEKFLEEKSLDELMNYEEDGYRAGEFAFQYLSTYFQGSIGSIDGDTLTVYRRILAGNLLAFRFAKKVSAEYSFEFVVTLNGNLCQTQPGYYAFRSNGTRVITWDDYPPGPDTFMWSQDEPAVFGMLDERVWDEIKAEELKPEEDRAVQDFLNKWAAGDIGDFSYHPNPEKSVAGLRKRLGLSSSKRLYVAFTNVVWDSACLGQDVGFKDMPDWLFDLCSWFAENPDEQLLIRVHPAEKRLPKEYKTITGIAPIIRKKFNEKMPGNIIIVDADDDAYSYTLAEMADGIGVYTSSLGYELAAKGKKVWVAGKVHYQNKGFTLDIKDKSHLCELLSSKQWDSSLAPSQVELAKKYIYCRFYRQIIHVPFLSRTDTRYTYRPFFEDLNFLLPGKDLFISTFVDRLIDGQPIIDIPSHTTAKWKEEGG